MVDCWTLLGGGWWCQVLETLLCSSECVDLGADAFGEQPHVANLLNFEVISKEGFWLFFLDTGLVVCLQLAKELLVVAD